MTPRRIPDRPRSRQGPNRPEQLLPNSLSRIAVAAERYSEEAEDVSAPISNGRSRAGCVLLCPCGHGPAIAPAHGPAVRDARRELRQLRVLRIRVRHLRREHRAARIRGIGRHIHGGGKRLARLHDGPRRIEEQRATGIEIRQPVAALVPRHDVQSTGASDGHGRHAANRSTQAQLRSKALPQACSRTRGADYFRTNAFSMR